jgi:putative PIN family toxin of toxin-antitoxin system
LAKRRVVPRIVLDTNVWISGLLSSSGPPAAILRAFKSKRVQILVADATVDEVLRVMNYPKIRRYPHITEELLRSVAALLVFHAERIEITPLSTESPDPDDNVFLDLAKQGKADALVTGDKSDLLALGTANGIPIITARKFTEDWNIPL